LDDKADIAVFQTLIPSMVSVLHQTMEAGNEDGARKGFDVFETLLILVSSLFALVRTARVEADLPISFLSRKLP